MSNFLCLVAISVVFSLGAAERRWCRPSLVDVTIAIDGWVEYDDVTFACVTCPANTSQTRLINRRRLDSYECCNGLLLAKGSCNEVVRNPAGTCSMGEKCDGVKQCTDGSDELNCGACNGTNRFSCSQYHDIEPCVGTDQVCDGRKDCELGLDETGCNWYGGWCDGFLCGGAHPRCIPQSQVCDGTKQCMDGSDEHNCRYCLHQFRCSVFSREDTKSPGVNTTTAECVGSFRVCDGYVDCLNGLDEENCYRWREWAGWSSCGTPTPCARTRSRECVDKSGANVAAHYCHQVEDYHDGRGSWRFVNQSETCPECLAEMTTTTYETTPTTTDIQTTQMTTDELTTKLIEATTQEHSGDSETTASRTTEPSNEYPTTASQYTIMTSSVGIITTQYASFTTEQEISETTMTSHSTTTSEDHTTNSDSTLPTHQPRTAGLSLAIIISLACAAAFILIILIVLCVFCCSERRRKTGKWIPRRRKERTPVRVSQMYYDVPLDGVVESVCGSNSNRNLKISGFDSFSATAPSAVDSGIDDNHSTTSTRRTNHSPSLSIGSKSNQSDDEFPAPPSPLINQNTSV